MSVLTRLLAKLPKSLRAALSADEREPRRNEVVPPTAVQPGPESHLSSYRLVGRRRAQWSTQTEEALVAAWVPLFLLWLRAAVGSHNCIVPSAAWPMASRAAPPHRWATDPWVLRVCAAVVAVAMLPPPTREMVQRLVDLRDLLRVWLRPDARRARPARQAVPVFLWYVSGWCLFVVVTRMQAEGSVAERLQARRRLVGLPSTAGAMLLGISERASGEDLLDWLAVQLVAFTSETPDRAAVYMLSAPTSVYLGYSGRRVADAGVTRLSTLDSRFWEHFRDIERARHSHGYTKVSCFSKVDASMLVMTAVAVGPRTDMLSGTYTYPYGVAVRQHDLRFRQGVAEPGHVWAPFEGAETQTPTPQTLEPHSPHVATECSGEVAGRGCATLGARGGCGAASRDPSASRVQLL